MADGGNKQDHQDRSMTLGEHLEELRARVILSLIGLTIGVTVCLYFGSWIIAFLEKPYIDAMGMQARLQSLSPADGFTSFMKITAIAGVVLSSPWIFYQLWMFVSAGLYPHEKRYVYIATPFSAGLFIIGCLFFLFIIAPATLKFLVNFNKSFLGVDSNFTFQNYISFITLMMLTFGVAFQTPIAVYFLIRTGLVSTKMINQYRRVVIFGAVVISAFVTPGDLFSLLALAISLYLLFESGVLLGWFAEKRAKARKRKQNI
jgi:sec-independent protein translocase protein TatC